MLGKDAKRPEEFLVKNKWRQPCFKCQWPDCTTEQRLDKCNDANFSNYCNKHWKGPSPWDKAKIKEYPCKKCGNTVPIYGFP